MDKARGVFSGNFARVTLMRFAESHAGEMSRRISLLELDEIRTIIGLLPDRHAGKLLAILPDSISDRLVESDTVAQVAAWLSAARGDHAQSIIHRMRRKQRRELLSYCERHHVEVARRIRAVDTARLGSVLNPAFVRVLETASLNEVSRELKAAAHGVGDEVYVCDEDGRYLGRLGLHRVLTAAPETIAKSLAEYVQPIPLESTLQEALPLPSWENHRYLPVVDRHQRLVGSVHRGQIKAALSKRAISGEEAGSEYVLLWLDLTVTFFSQLMNSFFSGKAKR